MQTSLKLKYSYSGQSVAGDAGNKTNDCLFAQQEICLLINLRNQ